MADNLEVTIDREECMGAAFCSGLASDVFETDTTGRVSIVGQEIDEDQDEAIAAVPPGLEEDVRSAASSCPAGAIVVREAVAG